MSLLRDLEEDIAEQRPRTLETAQDVVTILTAAERDALPVPVISLDMYIAYREEFHSGWILWLGSSEVAKLSPETRVQLSMMTFERRAKHFFRLSLWNRHGARAADVIADIPDGAEIFVPRVTGLRLWDMMAQGNASRVDHVVMVEDDEQPPTATPTDLEDVTSGTTATTAAPAGTHEPKSDAAATTSPDTKDVKIDVSEQRAPPDTKDVKIDVSEQRVVTTASAECDAVGDASENNAFQRGYEETKSEEPITPNVEKANAGKEADECTVKPQRGAKTDEEGEPGQTRERGAKTDEEGEPHQTREPELTEGDTTSEALCGAKTKEQGELDQAHEPEVTKDFSASASRPSRKNKNTSKGAGVKRARMA